MERKGKGCGRGTRNNKRERGLGAQAKYRLTDEQTDRDRQTNRQRDSWTDVKEID